MSTKPTIQNQKLAEIKPKITVIGVGGAGGNAVNNMIRYKLEGVDFVVANTDAQALTQSLADKSIRLGMAITQGLGAGSKPVVGKSAAEETIEEVIDAIKDSNMVFITAGMGGGTGTGAGPVIAKAARDRGILTIGVVTKPFSFEGAHRMKTADAGIEELQQFVDTLIVIPNQNLFRIANERTTFADAFKMADDVLYSGVRGVTDLMIMPGLINLDFADIRTVMGEMGKAMMGTGEAEGEGRAINAAEAAISNPLLDDVSMKGAKGVLISITGGFDMTLFEVDEAANRIREEVDADANIIFGSTFDERLNGRVRVSVVATGIDSAAVTQAIEAAKKAITPIVVSSVGPTPPDEFKSESALMNNLNALNETQTVYPFPLQNNAQEEDDHLMGQNSYYQPQTHEEPLKRKLSFFERLTGVTKTAARAPQEDPQPRIRPAEATQNVFAVKDESEDNNLDIPAFLRRKGTTKS
jgi:cell division protein FtsZ